ncbi:MAG: site-2 protease family protein [Gammaproteobacteria bacterium]
MARWLKVPVARLAIGFGKPIWRTTNRLGTEIVLGWFPFGGYVRFAETTTAFQNIAVWRRLCIALAGVTVNVLLAWLLFWAVFTLGVTRFSPIIAGIVPNSPAAHAGMQAGDEIIAIDHAKTPSWSAVAMALVTHIGETKKLSLILQSPMQESNHNQLHHVKVDLATWQVDALNPQPLSSFGIVIPEINDLKKIYVEYPLQQAWVPAAEETLRYINFNVMIVYKLLVGELSIKSLGGPLTLLNITSVAVDSGIVIFLQVLAVLSIMLAVLNCLPIPGLDGAQVIYLIIEWIAGKPVPLRWQALFMQLGIIVIALLFVQAMVNDMLRLGGNM